MSKSSKNSKEEFSQEISKVIKKAKDVEGKKHKDDKLNNSKGSKSQTSSFVGSYLVGKSLVSKKKKLMRTI